MGTETETEKTKSFHIKGIPLEIHHQWKIVAAFNTISMESVAIKAIEAYCAEQLIEIRNVLALSKEERVAASESASEEVEAAGKEEEEEETE